MGNVITKIVRLSDKLSRSELNELEQQTQTKFIFKGVCGEIDFYANCSDVFKIKYKRSGAQYLIKGLEVSENEFYKTYNHIWRILENNNNIEFSQLTKWDSQRDLEAPYNMIPCAIKTFVIVVYAFRDGKVIYHDIKMNKHEATVISSFCHEIDSIQATGKYGAIVSTTPVSHTYKIDDNCVDVDTFIEVYNLFAYTENRRQLMKIADGIKWDWNSTKDIRGKRADIVWFDTGIERKSLKEQLKNLTYEKDKHKAFDIIEDCLNKYTTSLWGCEKSKYISKENEDMPKIVDYKYNEETGTTTLFWADKTQTTVTADNLTEANQFEGFCAACAKKLFGNKSTYLNQFDKWTVRIPERERLAAEKKAKEDKEREETKARKAAKKAERRAKREVELLAKEFADNYNHESVWEQAKKLAMKKYSVPADYFADDCDCHCNCKEFDVMDEDENNISD